MATIKKSQFTNLSAQSANKLNAVRRPLIFLSLAVLIAGIVVLPSANRRANAAVLVSKPSEPRVAAATKRSANEALPKIISIKRKQKSAGPATDGEMLVTTVHHVSTVTPAPFNRETTLEEFRAAQAARQGREHPKMPPIPEGVPTFQMTRSIPETVPTQPLVPPAINIYKNTSLMGVPVNSSFLSATSEPSVAENGLNIFISANWFAGVSTDAGSTFTLRDPFTLFPPINGGFCCDQDVLYVPSHNLFIWYLQYVNDVNGNVGRLAWTTNPAGAWSFIDLRPEEAGPPYVNLDWFDYPMLGVTNNHIYVNTNIFTSAGFFKGAQAIRIALNNLVTPPGGGIPTSRLADTGGPFYCPAQGTTGTLYFFRHLTSSLIRVYSWADGASGFPPSNDVAHANFVTSGYNCTDTGGNNMCGFEDSRLQAAWVAGGKIGVMWNAAQGNPVGGLGNFPFPDGRERRSIQISCKRHGKSDFKLANTCARSRPAHRHS
jgi:hypothetical protein